MNEWLHKEKKRFLLSSLLFSLLFVIAIVLTVLGFIFMNLYTRLTWILVLCVVDVLLLSFCFYLLTDHMIQTQKGYSYWKKKSQGEKIEKKGVIVSLPKEEITLSFGVKTKELTVLLDTGRRTLYLAPYLSSASLEEGKMYVLEIADDTLLGVKQA